ncbi:class 1 fructose-bisphosphatase [Sphingobacterium psychroaquaticum]|uniref:Fructose-1,6-bisphosphatase class 1 n=1 Tax=Sphingobacterium psychroaquaticum TaxID=561061 RepID=A0A1X7JXV8_9SPHI|nr:class 1 fructose-bisphosphatase [Sphingobacterium psychroaquaticum]QBQ41249.1 class 1 fructose-bisphosphatase [Sphingobacterium psychroaquaticum]SMG32960.1 fructose-1,6-bisphosphatase I [Sphingobacterium psychroaquaticum]
MSLKTLGQFIIEKQNDFPYAKGELSRLLRDIGIAAKIINREVNKAGLADILGEYGAENIQGEAQKKLDVYADEQFIEALTKGGECCYVASEEHEGGIDLSRHSVSKNGKYIVCIDPLDGSSNIDLNVSVGSIFSIYRRKHTDRPITMDEVLQYGSEQVAAGYVIYGSSTMLVYSTGKGVNGFTLDPSIGEFCLSHPEMQIPLDGKTYSVNEGNYLKFPQYIKDYIKYCQMEDSETNRPYTSRYIGSMVADLHRTLIIGGIFLYPETQSYPQGKLRLLYECNPLAFIIEQAGGKAVSGVERILEIKPTHLHQRTSIVIGSKHMVEKVEEFYAGHEEQVTLPSLRKV